jgi:hypothetical protein
MCWPGDFLIAAAPAHRAFSCLLPAWMCLPFPPRIRLVSY